MKNDGQGTKDPQYHMPPEPDWEWAPIVEIPDALAQRIEQQYQHHDASSQTQVITRIEHTLAWFEKRLRVQHKIACKRDQTHNGDEHQPRINPVL
ncbi:hypothetical protein [Sideroxydans lithotrophicus]|uniref:hypothetical protein n=1 Tax=Sideroxydans lithotrophicus TaxID=63745 RepID=UPI00123257C0|nr:hypothetical protein [Sideroxydans lithotrophicus]